MFLQNCVCLRDTANNLMEIKEVIDIIVDLCGAKQNQTENHIDYLIRYG